MLRTLISKDHGLLVPVEGFGCILLEAGGAATEKLNREKKQMFVENEANKYCCFL